MKSPDILKLARPHLDRSQIDKFTKDLESLSERKPIIIAFENHIGKQRKEVDYAFYFKSSDFWKIEHDSEARLRGFSSYVSTVRRSRLGIIALADPPLVDGFWIEKDASRKMRIRELSYALVNRDFDVNRFIPDIRRIFRRAEGNVAALARCIDDSQSLRQVGMVSAFGIPIGFKLVYLMDPNDLKDLEVPGVSAHVINNYQALFRQPRIMAHVAITFGGLYSVSLELITPPDQRFSSCELWIELLHRNGINTEIQDLYNYTEQDSRYLLSGVSHIKIPVYRSSQEPITTADIKLYSGIMMRETV